LTDSGVFNLNAKLSVTTFTSPGTFNVNSSGELDNVGSGDFGGDFTWNGGVLGLSGGITLQPNSGLKTAGSDPKELTSGTLTSLALLTDLGGTGTLTIDHSGTFDNEAGEVDVTLPTISIPGASYGPGLFINNANGILKLETAGTLTIDGTFSNQGKLEVADGTTVSLSNLEFDTVNLDRTLQLGGDLDLAGGSTISAPTGLVVNAGAGVLKVGPATTLSLTMGANFFGNVEVEYNGGLTSGGKVTNSGKLTLDVGARTNLSAYQQTSDGTLEEHASGATSSSSLSVSGDAERSGTLDMVFDGGYTPTAGTVFPVLTAGSIGAHLDTTPANMTVTYDPTDVTLTQN
jgi:hypothetical protein